MSPDELVEHPEGRNEIRLSRLVRADQNVEQA
jgi:hypothetical protein